jgi:hypothetical protein
VRDSIDRLEYAGRLPSLERHHGLEQMAVGLAFQVAELASEAHGSGDVLFGVAVGPTRE